MHSNGILRTRTSPNVLYETLKNLSEQQKKDVEEIGLGCLLEMKLDGIPSQMGYYVVDNFDPANMRLKLKNGSLEVSLESVHRIPGLPKEGVKIANINASIVGEDILNTWKKQYGDKRIRPTHVLAKIKKDQAGGLRFKLNFLVIAMNILGLPSRVGACNFKFFG